MDVSITRLWKCWRSFVHGKRRTCDLERFIYYLESNLSSLRSEIKDGTYRHGGYTIFTVFENKKRTIAVACIRDRIVHRLLYEYLVSLFDHTFVFDVWSCRKGKGLCGAIDRAQYFLTRYRGGYVWRADIKKFFDHVDHSVLEGLLRRRVSDTRARVLLREVIHSYSVADSHVDKVLVRRRGVPIGNLTSQVFANIYLNELDRFVTHSQRPLAYMRYGDDFIVLASRREELERCRNSVVEFLERTLHLAVNPKHDTIVRAQHGIHFLGCDIFPYGRRLCATKRKDVKRRLAVHNVASYGALVRAHETPKYRTRLVWDAVGVLAQYEL